ncbi:hypothetical protein [Sphingomonas sp. 37zxx]|uniref:hypothetical protein n=1 Tax=Sphingomonas sp. 37zxx TaxID=1550073 RepID=UPI0012E03A66|nr:hypothetical protein [Sphingomonas sp. 37zxx]
MPFVSDPDAYRTYDPVRGLELVREGVGGGSSGYMAFKIKGNDREISFHAMLTSTRSAFGDADPSPNEQPCWKIYSGGALDSPRYAESRHLIEEAMIAYRSSFGVGQPQWQYYVYFEPFESSHG